MKHCDRARRPADFAEQTVANCIACGMRQIVVRGAGFDTFLPQNRRADLGTRAFEVDCPASQFRKARGRTRSNHCAGMVGLFLMELR
jgi:O-methyltransferase involved in polyketide biosynthesis